MNISRIPYRAYTIALVLGVSVSTGHAMEDEAHRYYNQGAISKDDLLNARSVTRQQGKSVINEIRATALKESAFTYGNRAGFYARMLEINQLLDKRAAMCDRVFNFAPLMLSHDVLPPVVQSGIDNIRIHNGDAQTMRVNDAYFDIIDRAKFATSPPNWRSYLYINAKRPAPPDESLMPDQGIQAEVDLWQEYVDRGWDAGVQQANRTFELKLNELTRDITGMALYRELLAKDMVTPPRVDEKFLGVTGSGRTMAINDRLFTISVNAQFVRKNNKWKPYVSKPIQRSIPDRDIDIEVHFSFMPDKKPEAPTSQPVVIEQQGWGDK